MNYTINDKNEATLVRDTLDIFFKAYFRNTPLKKCYGADCMIRSSSKIYRDIDPSLATHGKRADYSIVSSRDEHFLLALEAKRIGASMSGDFIQLAKELKEAQRFLSISEVFKTSPAKQGSLKEIGLAGYQDVYVVGLLLEGYACKVFVMDHIYGCMYRMVLVDKWYLPRDRYNMGCIKSIVSTMHRLKSLVENAARVLNKPSILDEDEDADLPMEIMPFHTPMVIRATKLDLDSNDPRVKNAKRKLNFNKL